MADDMQMPDVWQGQEWPLHYNDTGTFTSGAAGAETEVSFVINNRGHHVYGCRFSVFYAVPNEFEVDNLDFRLNMRVGGLDTAYTANITLSQSNVTNKPVPIPNIDSKDGTVRMYWPVPLRLRGGNQIDVALRRLLSYPTVSFGDPLQEFQPVPTVQATLVTGQFLMDQFPAGPPGSTGVPA